MRIAIQTDIKGLCFFHDQPEFCDCTLTWPTLVF
jgi:hypothetical protein